MDIVVTTSYDRFIVLDNVNFGFEALSGDLTVSNVHVDIRLSI